jgi:hypothetical protein
MMQVSLPLLIRIMSELTRLREAVIDPDMRDRLNKVDPSLYSDIDEWIASEERRRIL